MRWRTEGEVKRGKGQFVCGATDCTIKKKLTTWEVCVDSAAFVVAAITLALTSGQLCVQGARRAQERAR